MLGLLNYSRLTNILLFNKAMESRTVKILQLEQKVTKAEVAIQNLVHQVEGMKSEVNALKALNDCLEPPCTVASLKQKRLLQTSAGLAVINGIQSEESYLKKKAKYSFERIDDYVVVYTDGACPSNGRQGARAGIGIWFGIDHPLNVGKPCPGERRTNNAAEIYACAEACKIAAENSIEKLQINTDSKFVIDCITKWMPVWKKNNWKTSVGKNVINKEELIILEKNAKVLKDVRYIYVAGHAGILGNEGADGLAVKGANM